MLIEDLGWVRLKPPATDMMIGHMEMQLGVTFPADYLAAARIYHGAVATEGEFVVYRRDDGAIWRSSLALLLSLDPRDDAQQDIISLHNRTSDFLPQGLLVFGLDGADGCLCFDYNVHPLHPPVVFWSAKIMPDTIFFLARNFSRWVAEMSPRGGVERLL